MLSVFYQVLVIFAIVVGWMLHHIVAHPGHSFLHTYAINGCKNAIP